MAALNELEKYRSKCLKIIHQIGYDESIAKAVKKAHSEIQIDMIMRRAAKEHNFGKSNKKFYPLTAHRRRS